MKSKYSSRFDKEVKQRLLLRRSLLADGSVLFLLLLSLKRDLCTLPFPRAPKSKK